MLIKKFNQKLIKDIVGSNAGMSLIEILIALTLLALAGTFITGKVFENLQEGKIKAAKIQIKNLGDRLEDFRRHCGFYPETTQGLDALVSKPTSGRECKKYAPGGYIKDNKIPLDPWDNEFEYESDGKKYVIKSLGSDGQEGGEDLADKDILSTDI